MHLAGLIIINSVIALMVFGMALSLHVSDFAQVLRAPRAPCVGLAAQFVLLPALSCAATIALRVPGDLALAMLLVACCPGGNFSNVLTWLGQGNTATSVTMTAVSSAAAVVLMPLNFALYTQLNPATRALTQAIALDGAQLALLIVVVLGVPLLLGMLLAQRAPILAARLREPWRIGSLIALVLLVGVGFAVNLETVRTEAGRIVGLATLHNASALALGAAAAWLARLSVRDQRAVTMEVGVQNTGLGLGIAFTVFGELPAVAVLVAFWGVPHLVTGLGLARWWIWRDQRRVREQ